MTAGSDEADPGAGGLAVVPPAEVGPDVPPDVEEVLRAAAAVATVAVALARYAVAEGVRRPRAALRQLPRPPGLPVVLPGWPARLLGRAGGAVGALADRAVPAVVHAVVSRVDLTALVQEFVDLDRLAATIDVDAVIARADVDAVADRLDLARVVDRLEIDAVADRIDLDRIVDRLDLDGIVARVDLDKAVERVDLDRAVERVDLDRIVERADVVAIARYVVEALDLPALVRSSTGSVTTEMVRSVRDQGVDADRAVERVVDRLLRRSTGRSGPVPRQGG